MIDPSASAETPRPSTRSHESDEAPARRPRRRRSRRSRREGEAPASDSSNPTQAPGTGGGPAGDAPAATATSDGPPEAPASGTAGRPRRRGRRTPQAETSPEGPAGDGAAAEPDSPEAGEGTTRKRKKRARRRKKTTTAADNGAVETPASSEAAGEDSQEGDDAKRRTKRPRRSRKAAASAESDESGESTESAGPQGSGEGEAAPKRSRRRGSRGGRRRRRNGGADTAVGVELIPGESDELPEIADLPAEAELIGEGTSSTGTSGSKRVKASRKRKAGRGAKEDGERRRGQRKKTAAKEEPEPAPAPKKNRIILVNAGDPEETRVCVLEDGRIVDLQMSVKKQVTFVHDIYRGRVVNLEPAIGAAFVDFGQGRNGFLHASDVLPAYGEPDWSLEKLLSTPLETEAAPVAEWEGDEDEEAPEEKPAAAEVKKAGSAKGRRGRSRRVRMPIEKLVKKGQMVVVQITKDAIGDKGPTLTTYVSIPGRYLVLMPSLERTGVSRKIDDDRERRRLKRILSSLDIPEGMGVIVRTAGVGKTKSEIKRDLEYLLLAWEDFSRRLVSGRNPMPLYQESDVAIRTMRDLFTSETESVIVDDKDEFDRMVAFTRKLMPEFVDRVKLHDGARPLLHTYGVEQDFEKIFARRVELPSGGSIVLDQTEALVAIDVNSGRTREKGADFEDIALKTNLEAAPEIARQIRLRDLGGIIVLDYIDMVKASSRRAVEKVTRDALKDDRARSKIGRISQFGLLEMTRQRLGPGLSMLVFETCRRCRGTGRQRSASSKAQAILRRLGTALTLKGFTTVEVRAHPEVIEYLKSELSAELAALEERSGRKVELQAVPDQVEDSVLHYLRADGREVRPGGRRKR